MPTNYHKSHVNSANLLGIISFSKFFCGALVMLFTVSACAKTELVADISAGEKKSAICGQCHGQNGISIIPIYPNLAGQKQGYLELSLKAFRSGERINAAMTPHAKRLSDQDIADLSAYYANINVVESSAPVESK